MTENKRTLWFDENSQPPRNYIWYKNGKFWEFVDGKWVESEGLGGNGGGNTIYDSIEDVANPKEGDIVVCPDKYEEVGVASNGNPITLDPLKEYKLEVVEQPADGSFTIPVAYEWSSPTYQSISTYFDRSFSGFSELNMTTGQVKVLEHTVEAYNKEYHDGEWIDRSDLFNVVNSIEELNNSTQKTYTIPVTNKSQFYNGNTLNTGDIVTFTSSTQSITINNRVSCNVDVNITEKYILINPNRLNMILNSLTQDAGISTIKIYKAYSSYGGGTLQYTIEPYIYESVATASGTSTEKWSMRVLDINENQVYISTINNGLYYPIKLEDVYSHSYYQYYFEEEEVEPSNGAQKILLSDYLDFISYIPGDGSYYKSADNNLKKYDFLSVLKLTDYSLSSNDFENLAKGVYSGIVVKDIFYNIDYADSNTVRFANRTFTPSMYGSSVTFGYQDTVTLTTAPTTDIDTVEELEDLGFTSDVFDKINKGLITYVKVGNDSYKITNYSYNPSYYNGLTYITHYSVTFGNYNITKNVGVDTTVIVTINN